MNRLILMASLAGALALPLLAAPSTASASCADRKATGTVLGGVGGALIGNSISHGGGGAILGGLGGAVIGHQIASSGCYHERRTAYYGSRSSASYDARPAARPVRYVYYDQYGNAVAEGPAPGVTTGYTPTAYRYSNPPACRTEMQSYYDDRGALVQRPVQICDR